MTHVQKFVLKIMRIDLSATILSVKFYGQDCCGHFEMMFFKDKRILIQIFDDN